MPINNITQTISTIPPAGARGVDVQTQFVIKQEDFQDHLQGTTVTELNTLKDQLNTRIGEINSTATTMNGYATSASSSATTATTKAGEASTSASGALTSKNQASTSATNALNSATSASSSASTATTKAGEASTSASTATTKASEASASASGALTSRNQAETFKNNASTSASTATTKASEASASALNASTSASTATTKAGEASTSASGALTSRNQAETFKNNASASATKASQWADNNHNVEVETGKYSAKHWSVVAENVVGGTVKLTGNQTIGGTKTFSSSPIVPVPTTDFQSVPLRSTNITVNVGTGQTYTTINQALEHLSGFYPMYKKGGVTATINLKAGFVMAEQVLVSGIDLGWITIVGENSETIITHTALTTIFYGNYPAFGVDKGGTSPVIGQLFRFNVEKVGGNKHGLLAFGAGSSAEVLSGKGFIGAGTCGIFAAYASTINAAGANCSNAGAQGIHASFSSIINASGANCSNAGAQGIYAIESSIITANGANCSNAGAQGIYAIQSSTVSAYGAIIQNQTTGIARISVNDGSTIEASNINTTGGTVPVFSQAVNTLTSNGIIYQ